MLRLVAHFVSIVIVVVGDEVLIVVVVVAHLVRLELLGRFLEINGLPARPSASADDILGGDGFEGATIVFVFIYWSKHVSGCSWNGSRKKSRSEHMNRSRRTFGLDYRKERRLTTLVTDWPRHVSHARTHNLFGLGFALAVVLIDAHFMGGGVLDRLALALVKCTGGIARGLVAQGRTHVVVSHCEVAGIESD